MVFVCATDRFSFHFLLDEGKGCLEVEKQPKDTHQHGHDYQENREKVLKRVKQYTEDNKEVVLARKKQYRESNKAKQDEGVKRSYVKRNYDITLEDYNDIMDSADSCECCGSTDRLCYDHDHDTMKHRGVLCHKCNTGIGLLGDNLDGLEQALKYLRKHYVSTDD